MASRNSPVILTAPNGASARCAARKRFAVAADRPPNDDGKAALTVLFRTDDQGAAIKRARREAGRGRTYLFGLATGRYLGTFLADGTYQQPYPTSTEGARK